jgi:uncharacterized protein (DUF2236 family)
MSGSFFPDGAEVDQLLLGPESVAWRATSDLRLYFGTLYPLLLQVAHPTVDAGVAEHSDFERRPWDRLLGTVDYVSMLVYGGRGAAVAGRRLRAFHGRLRGTRDDGEAYSALEPEAYAWVHATLLDTYVRANAHFGTPLSPHEIERFYGEYRGLGRLIGVREQDLPGTWGRFRSYFRRTASERLRRTVSVERVLHTIHNSPAPPMPIPDPLWRLVRVPARRALWLGGIGMMEPGVRRRLQIGWTEVDEAQLWALGLALRGLTPVMPQSLRIMGPGHLRWRRQEIADGPLGALA